MIHVTEAVELLLVFVLMIATLAILYFLGRWIDRDKG